MTENTYKAASWEIDVFDGWTVEPNEDCHSVFDPDGFGALQISARHKRSGEAVTMADMLTATKLDEAAQTHLSEQTWGGFRGYQLVYATDETFWRKWWLTDGRTFLFVTYNCDKEDQNEELGEVNQMLSSLRSR